MLGSRLFLLLLMLLLGGCGKTPDPATQSLDQAIDRGYQFLESRQSADGKWISPRYPMFRDGYVFTPLVGVTFMRGDRNPKAVDKARVFMRRMPSKTRDKLIFPAYVVAETLVLFGGDSETPTQESRHQLVAFLKERQMTESLQWSPGDPPYGGWAETNQIYSKPDPQRRMDPSRLADLSTTLFVVSGLRAAEVGQDDPAIKNALGFVERCQNFDPPSGGSRDGGFFFCPGGSSRNKAGELHSYGSTTADGMRALMLCGRPPSDPRVKAARRWLVEHFDAEKNAGEFPKNKETVRNALYFYYCASAALALQESSGPGDDVAWARRLSESLLRQQKPDGSWSNPVPVYCEDDPILATLFALRGLVASRKALQNAPH